MVWETNIIICASGFCTIRYPAAVSVGLHDIDDMTSSSHSSSSDTPRTRHISNSDMTNDTAWAFSNPPFDRVLPHPETSPSKRCHERCLHYLERHGGLLTFWFFSLHFLCLGSVQNWPHLFLFDDMCILGKAFLRIFRRFGLSSIPRRRKAAIFLERGRKKESPSFLYGREKERAGTFLRVYRPRAVPLGLGSWPRGVN